MIKLPDVQILLWNSPPFITALPSSKTLKLVNAPPLITAFPLKTSTANAKLVSQIKLPASIVRLPPST